jgi:hypothetical protein
MKKVLIILILIFFSSLSFAQWTMSFCNNVDDQNNLSGFYKTFSISPSGGYIYVVVDTGPNETMGTHKIGYDIYKDGTYSTTLYMDVQPDWTRCWKQVTFYDKGEYKIEVYDEEQYDDIWDEWGLWECTGEVTITYN